MEQKRKKIEVNASSLVDLKAELLRKQEEIRQRKLQKNASTEIRSSKPITGKKGPLWGKKTDNSKEPPRIDFEEKIEEVEILDRAKKALLQKANLYDKLTKGDFVPEEDGSQLYLVDFQQKAIGMIAEERRKSSAISAKTEGEKPSADAKTEEISAADVASYSAKAPDDEWVDYTDSLGRSRRCMRKDLASLVEMDQRLTGKRPESPDSKELMSSDMKRELERQNWEKEAELEVNGPTGPVHYANVQFNEVRDHGVGFFGFAKDEETRQSQLDALNILREQTKNQREKHDQLKAKRKQMMDARLEKVKHRRIVKDVVLDIDLDPMAVEVDANSEICVEDQPKEPELLVRDDLWRKNAPTREWDKHKKQLFDEEAWLEKQREERLSEFAPPGIYDMGSKLPTRQGAYAKSFRPLFSPTAKPSLGVPSKVGAFSEPTSSEDKLACDAFNQGVDSEIAGDFVEVPREVLSDVSSIPLPKTEAVDLITSLNFIGDRGGEHLTAPVPSGLNFSNSSVFTSTPFYADFSGQRLNVEFELSEFCATPGSEPGSGLDQSVAANEFSTRPETGTKTKKATGARAPQPTHYGSAPMKPQPKGPKYEPVNLHEIPLTLPAPPSADSVPHYPSQEEVIASDKPTNRIRSEQSAINQWYRQFDQPFRAPSGGGTSKKPPQRNNDMQPSETLLRPSNIPFASPYIQKRDPGKIEDDEAASLFDPAKPPPKLEHSD